MEIKYNSKEVLTSVENKHNFKNLKKKYVYEKKTLH